MKRPDADYWYVSQHLTTKMQLGVEVSPHSKKCNLTLAISPLCDSDSPLPCPVIYLSSLMVFPVSSSRSTLCTMVHSAARWCTTQVGGARRSPVPTKWCTTLQRSRKRRRTDRKSCIRARRALAQMGSKSKWKNE